MIEKDSIKISPKPFVFITLLFMVFVIIGSSANYFRMKNRFNSLVDHSKVIYNTHKNEVENLFKRDENVSEIKNLLENINSPERGVYLVDIIRNIDGSWMLFDYQESGVDKSNLNQKDIDLIQNYINLDNNKKFGFQKSLKDFYNNFYKYPYYNQDFLISILPVDQNSETVGYFIVATSKVQNN